MYEKQYHGSNNMDDIMKRDTKRLTFGPFAIRTYVDLDLIQDLDERAKQDSTDYRKALAGRLKSEWRYSDDNIKYFEKKLAPYFNLYIDQLRTYHIDPALTFKQPKGKLISLWMNYMHAGDYNPLHNHSGSLSFVIYIDVPDVIYEEENPANGFPPGTISFIDDISFFQRLPLPDTKESMRNGDASINDFIMPTTHYNLKPRTGEILIFPSYLMHSVEAFQSSVVRKSVSGNIRFD